ncbi:hypothetical protein BDV27DRAFT_151180 [Aspergillus caelatus]|uniref:Uncharacterized protein n=1 Tax=Aspergillus caelatus TaxID=61420 RepID=A0A5N6ZJ16_9EURO|nr:uncharacterized protein BDV27DRAFT_151180 [Aspergillus caelatus]KAE8357617.1 hypothetical protein BDV27DRAFT_151180 [Aspergillus caelatus]
MDTISCILISSIFNSVWELRKFFRQKAYSLAPGVFLVRFQAQYALYTVNRSESPAKIFPRKTSSGSLASCIPNGVKFSEFVKALTSLRESIARRMFLEEGASRASRRVGSTSPSLQIFTRSTKSCKERRSISGVCCSASYTTLVEYLLPELNIAYQFFMSVLREHVKTDSVLNTPSSSPSLFRISPRDKGFN